MTTPRWQDTATQLLLIFKCETFGIEPADEVINAIDEMFREIHPGNYRLHWIDYTFTVDFDTEEDKTFWLLKNS